MADFADLASSAQERHLEDALTKATGRKPRSVEIPDPWIEQPQKKEEEDGL